MSRAEKNFVKITHELVETFNLEKSKEREVRAKKEMEDLMKTMKLNDPDPSPIQVIWTLNKGGNIGTVKGFDQFNDVFAALKPTVNSQDEKVLKESSVQPQKTKIEVLLGWCQKHGYVKHNTSLCPAIGMKVECYAKPYQPEDVDNELMKKNNILAALMTMNQAGIVQHTMIGKAVFIRHDDNGKAVSFDRSEAIRLMLFFNDFRGSNMSPEDTLRFHSIQKKHKLQYMIDIARFSYPYYNPFDGSDNFILGYGIRSRKDKNSYVDAAKKKISPPDRKIVPTFLIQGESDEATSNSEK